MPNFNPNKARVNWLIEGAILSYSLTCFLIGILVTLWCLYDPCAFVFIGNMFPDQYCSSHLLRLVATIFHGYLMLILEINVALTGSVVMVYLFYITIFLTKELRMNCCHYKTSDNLRELHNLQKIYRSFQILNEHVMFVFGPYITLFHGIFVVGPVFGNFIIIRYWTSLDILSKGPVCIACWIATIFWLLVLQLGKYLWVGGKQILWSWRQFDWKVSERERSTMKKFTKSCRPILIFHGKQFVVGRLTQFTYFKAVIRGLFRVLLTGKDS